MSTQQRRVPRLKCGHDIPLFEPLVHKPTGVVVLVATFAPNCRACDSNADAFRSAYWAVAQERSEAVN